MSDDVRTTETLRASLFDTLEAVRSGKMDPHQASAVAKVAEKIIQTAQLELEYAEMVSRLDKMGQGVSPGPLVLTNRQVLTLKK